MSHIPALDLATEIASQEGTLTLGTNIFHSTVRAPDSFIPKNCVFVWGAPGRAPLRTMGDPDEIRAAVVHVRVRNSKFATGSELIRSIMDLLRGDDISTYLEVKIAASEPRAMGQDSNANHYFGMEYIMTYQEP